MRLTPAQVDILRYHKDGFVCSEIAQLRHCAESTVRSLERQVRVEMGVSRTRLAVRRADNLGLL